MSEPKQPAEKPSEDTQKPAEDKAKPQPKAPASKQKDVIQKASTAVEMTREEGRKRIEASGNSTHLALYDFYVSNGKSPKEAVRQLLKKR